MKQYLKIYFICLIFAIVFFVFLAIFNHGKTGYYYVPKNIIVTLIILIFPGMTRYFLQKAKDVERYSKSQSLNFRVLSYIFFVPFILYFTLILINQISF